MADQEPIKEIRKMADDIQQKYQIARLKSRAPIAWLNPEAHEDALKASKPLFIEGKRLLGQNPMCHIETPENELWMLQGKEFAKGVANAPVNTEFLIYVPNRVLTKETDGEIIEYRNLKYYAISPAGVILVEINEANLPGKNGLIVGESRMPKGRGIEKREMGEDEINTLTNTLKNKINYFPNGKY